MKSYGRYLRIGWTAFCGLLCVLLIALWVRSYYWVDQVFVPVTRSAYVILWSMPNAFGIGFADDTPNIALRKLSVPTIDWLAGTADGTGIPWNGYMKFSISVDRVMVPYWFGVLLSATLPIVPWIRRFSLRTLLIATTLVAAVLGTIVWFSR